MKKTIKLLGKTSVLFFSCMMIFGVNARAYIDPSVTTYLIQAIAGIVIAAGAAFGIYFRRAKKKMNEKLGIDENRNKEVESDEIIVKDDSSEK